MQDLDCAELRTSKLPSKAKTATHFEARLVIDGPIEPRMIEAAMLKEVDGHHGRLSRWTDQMPHLEALHLRMYLPKSHMTSVCYQVLVNYIQRKTPLISLPKVQRLVILETDDIKTYRYVRRAEALGVWLPGNKVVTKVPDEDGYIDNDVGVSLGPEHD